MPEITYREKKRSRTKRRKKPGIFNIIISLILAFAGVIILIYIFTTPNIICPAVLMGISIALIGASIILTLDYFI